MLLPLLLSLALQSSQDTWSGLEVSKVYTTGHSPAVLLGFDIDTRRALLAVKSQTGATLGTSVGYIAGASNVRPLEGVFAADIIWDASRGTVLTGQSLLMIEGARVSLDDGYEFSVSSTHSLADLLAEFPDDQVEEAEATAIGLEPMGMYGKNDRYGRIGPSQSLLVLPHGRQVVYASGENRVTRAWVIPGKDGGLHSFKWEDPSLGISRGEPYTYFRMRSDGNFAVRSRHLAQIFRLFRPDNSQRGQETNRLWEARKGQLLAWSQEQRDKAARYWNGWRIGGVYRRVPFQFAEEFLWVDPDKEMLYKLGISGKEVLEDRTYRARIIQSGLQRVNGNHITDVEWEGSYGGGSTFEIDGDKIDAGIGIEPYKYVADTKPEDLLPYLQTQLPPKFLKQEWPWLEPGAVYQGGRAGQGNYYICVLENGRDCLIGSQGSVYMTLLSMAFETGYKDERCLQFLGSRDRHVWVYSNKGNIMDHHMSQHHLPGGKPFSLTTEYDFVADELKKKYGFWSHPKKE